MKKMMILLFVFTLNMSAQIRLELIKSISGNTETDQLTNIVSLADINKDGYDDFALRFSGDSVYAIIYLGGKTLDSTKTILFTNPKPKFGFSQIFGGGDINGDGIKDFVISYLDFTNYHNPPMYEMQIHFGGKKIRREPDYCIKEITGDIHLCSIDGDFNGDGYDDIIISKPNYPSYGSIQIYYGGKELKQKYDMELYGTQDMYEFGRTMASLGDVNKDGFDDFIISEWKGFTNNYNSKAFLFYGGKKLSFDSTAVFTDKIPYGLILNTLGDINGDGYKDFFIGGVRRDIYLGRKQIDPQKPFKSFRKWLCDGIGDVNMDGYSDFIRYAINNIEIHLGNSMVDTIPDLVNNYGGRYVNIGDFDGDKSMELGYLEVIPSNKMKIYKVTTITSMKERVGLVTEYSLEQNYPNPFNPETTISYSIPKSEHVTLKVFDLLGREMITLVDEYKHAGDYNCRLRINNGEFASGVYFYQLRTRDFIQTKKLMVVK